MNSSSDIFRYCHYKVTTDGRTYDTHDLHVIFREGDLRSESGEMINIMFLDDRGKDGQAVPIQYRLISERALFINEEKASPSSTVGEPLYIIARGLVMDGESLLKKFKAQQKQTIHSEPKNEGR